MVELLIASFVLIWNTRFIFVSVLDRFIGKYLWKLSFVLFFHAGVLSGNKLDLITLF